MPQPPKEGRPEYEPQFHPYYLAATFRTRDEAQEPYTRAQQMIERDEDVELSAYRFERRPHDPKQQPLPRPWYVVVLGDAPPEPIQQQFQDILGAGELTQLSLETIVTLAKRRESETQKGSWVEGHHGAGVRILEATVTFRRKDKKEHVEKYTTRLEPSLVKRIKIYAAEHDLADYEVVKRAVEEYLAEKK